ncbi:MAG: DUF58 domain-containing protein, partial [Clostridiales bacterium]|nr:DUF58 domain-containing protein [Clostridiales bacterium]
AFFNMGIALVIVLNGLILALAILDFIRLPGKSSFTVERHLPASFEQGNKAHIELILTYVGRTIYEKGLAITITDTLPATFKSEQMIRHFPPTSKNKKETATIQMFSQSENQLSTLNSQLSTWPVQQPTLIHSYQAVPAMRGAFTFGACYVQLFGRWQLSTKQFALTCPGTAQVYPNLAPMRHYRMLAAKNQLAREDTALHKHRGLGMEFVGLREYTPDDDRRKINWKVSARAGKLITNVYDVEKNRNVIIAVDTGYWMQAPMGEVTRLDKALELAAAIAQVVLSSGDRVGLLLFDTQSHYYLQPGKGAAQVREILHALYSAKAVGRQPSYAALSTTLRNKLTKRAFICLLTYLDSPGAAFEAQAELMPLIRRHALFVASLADLGLEELINSKPLTAADIYVKAAAVQRRAEELEAIHALVKYGIAGNASEPGELLVKSIRHYLVHRIGGV